MAPDTSTRVELPSGGWAEIRTRMTVGDIRAQRQAAHDRGYPDEVLDSLSLLPRMVESWSFGAVDETVVDSMTAEDAVALIGAIGGSSPNASAPSSDGGEGKIRKMRAPRQ